MIRWWACGWGLGEHRSLLKWIKGDRDNTEWQELYARIADAGKCKSRLEQNTKRQRTICLLLSYTVESERAISMLHSEGSDVRIIAFRTESGVSSENSAQTDGDLRVLCEQHFVGDDCSVSSIIKEACNIVLRLGFVVRCASMKNVCCFFTAGLVGRAHSASFEVCDLQLGVRVSEG